MRAMTLDKTRTVSRVLWVVVGVVLLSQVQAAEAQTGEPQTTVGGHVGFVLPLVTHAGGETTNIVDNFPLAFRLELPSDGQGPAWPTILNWSLRFKEHHG